MLLVPPTPTPTLPAEDYHWWWRAYLTSGSSALYLFLYSLFYFYTKLDITKLVGRRWPWLLLLLGPVATGSCCCD